MFCQKTYLEKLSLYCYICIIVFSHSMLLQMQQQNTNVHIDMYQSCRHRTSTQNIWQQTRTQHLIAMDCYFFFYISREVSSIQRKTKAFFEENVWLISYNQPDLLTVELFLKLCISQRHVRNVESNWKNYVCVVVRILLIC